MTTGTRAPTPHARSTAAGTEERSMTWLYIPLRMAGILSVLVFLTRCALELFVAHGLHRPQHGWITLLDVTLSTWALAEIAGIDRNRTPVPLGSLRIAAGLQLAAGVIRGLAIAATSRHPATAEPLVHGVDLGMAAVWIPIDAAMFLVMSRLFIDAFSHTERVRAEQVEQQMALAAATAAELAAAHRARAAAEARQRKILHRKLKSSLAASAVAHEIHLPLSTILLRSRMALEHGSDCRDALAAVGADARQVVRTIEKMKVLLRSVQSEHTRVDLADVVQSCLVQFKWQMAQAGIDVEASGLDRPRVIEGDDVQLQLAVANVRPCTTRRVSHSVDWGSSTSASIFSGPTVRPRRALRTSRRAFRSIPSSRRISMPSSAPDSRSRWPVPRRRPVGCTRGSASTRARRRSLQRSTVIHPCRIN